MPLDDDLRDQLQRERNQLGTVRDPARVLDQLRPDMIRARRLRRLTHAGAAGLIIAGGFAAAQIGTGSDQRSLEIVPAYEPGDEPTATPDRATPSDSSTPTHTPSQAGSVDADYAVVDESTVTETVEAVDRPPAAPAADSDDSDPVDDDGPETLTPDDASESTSTIAQTGAPSTSGAHDDGASGSPDGDVGDSSYDSEGDDQNTTTTLDDETAGPTHFESDCGSVIADVSGEHPQIIEILPQPGYRATVEDEDHGSVTVHFEGGGEDCELKVS